MDYLYMLLDLIYGEIKNCALNTLTVFYKNLFDLQNIILLYTSWLPKYFNRK